MPHFSQLALSKLSYRPFALLKLIRDGVVTNVEDLAIPNSIFLQYVQDFKSQLTELHLIEVDDDGNIKTTDRWTSLAKGLKLSLSKLAAYDASSVICAPLFGVPSISSVEADVFVVMPFSDELKPVYEDHIRSVTDELGVTSARADDFFTARSVVEDIWNGINASRVVVADCTGRNPNVFYEIGVAHTLGKPVVLIAQTTRDIPFNIQHMRMIVYDFSPQGMKQFESALRKTLGTVLSTATSLEEVIQGYKVIQAYNRRRDANRKGERVDGPG